MFKGSFHVEGEGEGLHSKFKENPLRVSQSLELFLPSFFAHSAIIAVTSNCVFRNFKHLLGIFTANCGPNLMNILKVLCYFYALNFCHPLGSH